MSALALMAANENRWIKLGPDDVVIMSSHPIPGNESNVSKVIDGLVRVGAEVVHSGIEDVHATGHAKQEELKTFHSIARPDWFIPVHGEYRHLVAHARIAHQMGMRSDHVMVCEDGDQLLLTDDGLVPHARVPAGYLYVDGIVGDVGNGVLRDRRVLAEEGVVVVVVAVDISTGAIITGPEVITRGWVYEAEAEGPARPLRGGGGRRGQGGVRPRHPRHREHPAGGAPGRGQVRQRQHQAPSHDRPRGDGGLTGWIASSRAPA